MGTSDQRFSLRWNNYQSHLVSAFDSLLEEKDFIDVTLGVEGRKLPAHKMLLSACSPYFRDLLKGNPCQHPIIILRDIKYDDLFALLQFMYNGEVNVAQEQLNSFLKSAESLKIRGLTDNETDRGGGGGGVVEEPPTSRDLGPPPPKRKRPYSETLSPSPAPSQPKRPTAPPAAVPAVHPPPAASAVARDQQEVVKQEVIELGEEQYEEEQGQVYEGEEGVGGGGDQEGGYQDGAMVAHGGEEGGEGVEGGQGFWQSLFEVNVALEEGKDIFSCETCGKEFRNEGSLAQHKPIHRINTTCEICGTTLSRVQHYRRHMKTVHNIDPKTGNLQDGPREMSSSPPPVTFPITCITMETT